MTRRERLENKLAKREEWADKRRGKVAAVAREAEKYHGDVAFNTQPGHIPERARLIARQERAFADVKMAEHHDQKAAGLSKQLEESVFSDDVDAVEALERRIAEREAEADRCKAINAAWRKAKGTDAEKATQLVASGLMSEALAKTTVETMRLCPWMKVPLDTTNTRASIRRDKARIDEVKARQARAQAAEEAPNGVAISGTGDYVTVTFPEAPDRVVRERLSASGFVFRQGSWHGRRDRLPSDLLPTDNAGG